MKASELNGIRRDIASALDSLPCKAVPMSSHSSERQPSGKVISYKSNVSNRISRDIYLSGGTSSAEEAYELSHRPGAELMRTKYCIKYELGLCPVRQGAAPTGPLFLVNNGRRFSLGFDCSNCEMTVS